ncbi:MAG: PF20097 family protein [Pseudomonadota bacterium]
MNCPKCNSEMKAGYSSANTSLSWIDREKFESRIFRDEDLAQSGFKNLFPWKGEYFQAFNCHECKVVMVDYSEKYDRKTIESRQTMNDKSYRE